MLSNLLLCHQNTLQQRALDVIEGLSEGCGSSEDHGSLW